MVPRIHSHLCITDPDLDSALFFGGCQYANKKKFKFIFPFLHTAGIVTSVTCYEEVTIVTKKSMFFLFLLLVDGQIGILICVNNYGSVFRQASITTNLEHWSESWCIPSLGGPGELPVKAGAGPGAELCQPAAGDLQLRPGGRGRPQRSGQCGTLLLIHQGEYRAFSTKTTSS